MSPTPPTPRSADATRPLWPLLLLFTLATFLSASLLFLVQPMIARMILPVLGGAASVWTLCMVFFQTTLLLGYLYAWGSQRLLTRHPLPILIAHLVLFALAALSLPFFPLATSQTLSPDTSPSLWLLATLALSIGLPFLILSTSSPLLQAWFARTEHPVARDPYPLYAASNIGSLLALFAYPLLIEPALTLPQSASLWRFGFIALGLLLLPCALLVARPTRRDAPEGETHEAAEHAPLDMWRRARWVLWAAIPSSLLVGATSRLTTNVASVPMLWILPLAIYLLSFVFAFGAHRFLTPHRLGLALWLAGLVMMLLSYAAGGSIVYATLLMTWLAIAATAYHTAMALDRPQPAHLTEFYALMSLGGMLGGMFNGLLAPLIFDASIEFPITSSLALIAIPAVYLRAIEQNLPPRRLVLGLTLLFPLALLVAMLTDTEIFYGLNDPLLLLLCLVIGLYLLPHVRRARPFLLIMAIGLLAFTDRFEVLYRSRSFYGELAVIEREHGLYAMLHGNTMHGLQKRLPTPTLDPLSYYWRGGPAGYTFTHQLPPEATVAIVGVGTGSLCAYWRPGDTYHLFELDPDVIALASDERFFSFVSHCKQKETFIGDGRRNLERQPKHLYDLIVIDTFSSDAIPIHMLTREAFQVYLDHLSPRGKLLLHISNNYIDMSSVIARNAADLGLDPLVRVDAPPDAIIAQGASPSIWTVLSPIPHDPSWLERGFCPLIARPEDVGWTDHNASLWPLLAYRPNVYTRLSQRCTPYISGKRPDEHLSTPEPHTP